MGETDAGTLIANRYQLLERTAADSGGETWDAADLTVGRPLTLRLLRRARSEHTRRFLAAARLAARLHHPGIMQVYDYGQAGVERTPFLVTEPAGETTLGSLISTVPLEPAWVLDLLRQAASALDAAHAEGLVHDHIRPDSVLLVPGGAVKLSDFGLSRATGPPAGVDPVYLAPERMRGDPATPASDLYALGVVAWECLAGNSARREAGRGSRPLPGLPAMVGPGVAALVADLTAIDPADRPASAARAADRASRLQALPLDRHLEDTICATRT
jgi:serine/threonine-protein kinase